MAVFQSKKYRSAADAGTFTAKYRVMLAKHPFLLFGLPFMSVIIAGSFVLTPAAAVRYERHDRKVRQLTRDEELGVGKAGRKVNIKDEYYVRLRLPIRAFISSSVLTRSVRLQRLAAKDLDDWDQKRVKRLPGETDGIL
ncbi:hypothetical protein NUW58_g884 [Xylaria curta]|uniref:Uncharacterized protein n=1 Tax=Xylaria curta TaxID=42375 RepID=A0ACC1PPK9_9PEZI|nr:hypothetical protein NUW58_g884 [Xylaria curta]